MNVARGGTRMYCPRCQQTEVCAAIPSGELGLKSGQRWFRKDHPDIQWFRRARECQGCAGTFVSAEMNEQFLTELVELRKALADIKVNAEQYSKESAAASKSLEKLSKSLAVLKALDLYKKTK